MGAAESRLAFRNNVLKIVDSEVNHSLLQDKEFWNSLCVLPTSIDEVFALCGVKDVKKLRDSSPDIFEFWIRQLVGTFIELSCKTETFSDEEKIKVLNCSRLLARLLPYLFDKDVPSGSEMESRLFWPAGEVIEKTPGFQFVEAILGFLFWQGLTLPEMADRTARPEQSKTVYFAIWTIGIGASVAPNATREQIDARTEILQLLLILLGRTMYLKPEIILSPQKDRWTAALEKLEKRKVLTMLCSLMNTALSWDPVGYALLPYNHVLFGDNIEPLSIMCLQLFDTLLDYGYLAGSGTASNIFRHYLAKLHRKEDFDFILDNFARLLKTPLQAEHTLLPNSRKRIPSHAELLCFLWKLFECNPQFVKHMSASPKALDVLTCVVYFLLCSRCDATHLGLFRLCCFLLHQMSVEREFCVQLNASFDFGKQQFPLRAPSNFNASCVGQQGLGFPAGWRSGTFADFLILAINAAVTAPSPKPGAALNSSEVQPDASISSSYSALHETLLIVFSNVSPYMQNLSIATCQKLLHLYKSVSAPVFIFSREENHRLVFYLLEGMNFILAYQNHANLNLLYAIVRNAPAFVALKQLTFRQCEKAYCDFLQRKNGGKETPVPQHPELNEEWFSFWHSRLPLSTVLYFLLIVAPKLATYLHSLAGNAEYSSQEAITLISSLSLDNPAAESQAAKPAVVNPSAETAPAPVQEAASELPEETEFSADDLKLIGDIEFPVYTEESSIMEFLKLQNYVGLLPHPPPIYVRNFSGADDGIHIWFSSFLWGIIFLSNSFDVNANSTPLSSPVSANTFSAPPLFSGTNVSLFKIKFKSSD